MGMYYHFFCQFQSDNTFRRTLSMFDGYHLTAISIFTFLRVIFYTLFLCPFLVSIWNCFILPLHFGLSLVFWTRACAGCYTDCDHEW